MSLNGLKLLEALSRGESVAATSLRGKLRKTLEPLLTAQILGVERAGGGQRIAVVNMPAFDGWIAKQYPSGIKAAAELRTKAPGDRRTAGVSVAGDSKVLSGIGFEYILVRFADRLGASIGWDSIAHPIDDAPRAAPWPGLVSRIALVEGPVFFRHCQLSDIGVDAAILYNGRLSSRLLGWLQAQERIVEFVMCPDYDYVGMMEYDKVQLTLTAPVSLYLPEQISALLEHYGKRTLLTKQKQYASTVNARFEAPGIPESYRYVVNLIRTHGKGLEQEALLIPTLANE